MNGKKKMYKIRWKNYGESSDTWEPEDSLSCPDILAEYLRNHPEFAGISKNYFPQKVGNGSLKIQVKIQYTFVLPCFLLKQISAQRSVVI